MKSQGSLPQSHRGTEARTEPRKGNIFFREDTSRDPLSKAVIGAAIEVHRVLGPGLLESAYGDCLEYELREAGLTVAREVPLAIQYKKLKLSGVTRGLLLNFNVPLLKDGIKRMVY